MIFDFVCICFARTSVISIGKSSRESEDVVIFYLHKTTYQIIDVDNIGYSAGKIKSKFSFLFTVKAISRKNQDFGFQFFWMYFFHKLKIFKSGLVCLKRFWNFHF